jgi:hypothetical protein
MNAKISSDLGNPGFTALGQDFKNGQGSIY